MRQHTAINRLTEYDEQGRYVYTVRDLAKIFPEDSKRTFQTGLGRLTKQGVLQRVAHGVYVFALSRHRKQGNTLEYIARMLRRGEYNYISLESALSEYGVISQVPLGRITVMTTGRSGEYSTPYGAIEFTHTKRQPADIVPHLCQTGRPLRMASKAAAWRDLKRVGRNRQLVDEAMLHED